MHYNSVPKKQYCVARHVQFCCHRCCYYTVNGPGSYLVLFSSSWDLKVLYSTPWFSYYFLYCLPKRRRLFSRLSTNRCQFSNSRFVRREWRPDASLHRCSATLPASSRPLWHLGNDVRFTITGRFGRNVPHSPPPAFFFEVGEKSNPVSLIKCTRPGSEQYWLVQ